MSQPIWNFVVNLGDANPVEHGGYFVFIDKTGVYDPEGVILLPPCDGEEQYTVYRFSLEKCTFIDGVLSDNEYHPDHPAWWATPESRMAERPQDTTYLSRLCSTMDVEFDEIVRLFCSDDPVERAQAYRMVGEYHGWNNLDDYPLTLTYKEAKARYGKYSG